MLFEGLRKAMKTEPGKIVSSVSPDIVRALVPAVRATLEKAVFAL